MSDELVCEECGREFDKATAVSADYPCLTSLYRCPECWAWVEEQVE